jgi:hypothetical protein
MSELCIPINPTSIPEGAYLWSDNAGRRGRFPSESLVGFFRNPWSDNVGIRNAEGVASILAGWLMKDMKKESSGPRTGGTQQQLDEAGKELKGVQSVRSSTL